MKETTPIQRLELLRETLYEGSSAQLRLPDERLADMVFNEFQSDAWSFLHENTLEFLRVRGLISEMLANRCRDIRERTVRADNERLAPRTGHYLRESSEWREIRQLCDEALALLMTETPWYRRALLSARSGISQLQWLVRWKLLKQL